MLNLGTKKRGRPTATKYTSITLSTADLAALGDLIAAGQTLLRVSGPSAPVVSRLKAAMTRLKLPIPRGM